MKRKWLLAVSTCLVIAIMGCKAKYGCPSDGRNIGAERLNSGDKKAEKAAKKAGKFKYGKIPS